MAATTEPAASPTHDASEYGLAPRLLLTIRKQFPEVKAIRAEVQLVRGTRRGPAPIRRIGATGVRDLRALEARLKDGPLRDAVRRLIRRDAQRDDSRARDPSDGDD